MKADQVIVKPILTEKATELAKNQVYAFETHIKANKFQIKNVLERFYKVKVDKIRITVRKGKEKRAGRRMIGKRLPDKKIAYVKVKEGKIDLFPQT